MTRWVQLAMMGTEARAVAPRPSATRENLVPPDHFYRHLERSLDLGFGRDLGAGTANQLAQDIADVHLDGAWTQEQLLPNLSVRPTQGH
jgi:hypothetical protein